MPSWTNAVLHECAKAYSSVVVGPPPQGGRHGAPVQQPVDGTRRDRPCVHLERLGRRGDRLGHVGVRVRRRDHERLPEDSPLEQLLQQQGAVGLGGSTVGSARHEHLARGPAGHQHVVGDARGPRGGDRAARVAAAEQHHVHEQREQLVERDGVQGEVCTW